MKLYLSGPMSGYPDHNFPAFHDAAERLSTVPNPYFSLHPTDVRLPQGLFGYVIVNPATFEENKGKPWADCLRHDLTELLKCDGVATLDGWQESRGACLEVDVAQRLGMPVAPAYVWQSRR